MQDVRGSNPSGFRVRQFQASGGITRPSGLQSTTQGIPSGPKETTIQDKNSPQPMKAVKMPKLIKASGPRATLPGGDGLAPFICQKLESADDKAYMHICIYIYIYV